jgi:hypothetical protein
MMTRAVVCWMVLVGLAAAIARAEPAPVTVRFADGRLSVAATDAALDDVLAKVTAAIGAHVKGTLRTSNRVSITFEEVPIEDALRRLLGEQPFSLRYQGDKLIAVALVDVGSPARRAPAGAAGIALPNGDRYFPPPQARVVRDPTPEQLEAAKAEFLAAQRPLEPPSDAAGEE